jgi:hypothetical protein
MEDDVWFGLVLEDMGGKDEAVSTVLLKEGLQAS